MAQAYYLDNKKTFSDLAMRLPMTKLKCNACYLTFRSLWKRDLRKRGSEVPDEASHTAHLPEQEVWGLLPREASGQLPHNTIPSDIRQDLKCRCCHNLFKMCF